MGRFDIDMMGLMQMMIENIMDLLDMLKVMNKQ